MVSDRDIEDINKSIVAFFNEDDELSKMLMSDDVRDNSMMIEIADKRRPAGFVIRGGKADIIRGAVDSPTVKFTFSSKDIYYLMIEDIINGADVRSLITAMIFSNYPKIVVDPPIESTGMYHTELLLQIFSRWAEKMIGGGT